MSIGARLGVAPAEGGGFKLKALDYIIVNEIEAANIAAAANFPPAPESAAAAIYRQFGCATVVTLGAEGAVAAADGALIRARAPAISAIDTTGAGDAFAGVLRRRKSDQQRARAFRLLEDAHRDLGNDAKQALRAGDDAEQVVAAGVEMLAADTQHLAGDQHDFAAEHVVGGHAVFQAVHAAGIFRDIAADRAGDLRRWVGRVVKSGMGDHSADREIGHARLDHGEALHRARIAPTRNPRKWRRIRLGLSDGLVSGLERITTPSNGAKITATNQDTMSAMLTTAKSEKVYSPAELAAKPTGTKPAIVTCSATPSARASARAS